MVIRPHSTTFLSTLSLRRATYLINTYHRIFGEDFYPRSPCGERPMRAVGVAAHTIISIHALLAESDTVSLLRDLIIVNFYPRSPCGERRCARLEYTGKDTAFLSTLSLRRATLYLSFFSTSFQHFYPRSPCGERPSACGSAIGSIEISIHALLAESDRIHNELPYNHEISIHALLAESDG